jgi:hypothetical protein
MEKFHLYLVSDMRHVLPVVLLFAVVFGGGASRTDAHENIIINCAATSCYDLRIAARTRCIEPYFSVKLKPFLRG